ncbi:zinc-dependent alcohol dehydrogenase family protein [Phenylobacterium montanum]|uniref:Zinc-dependent alcohol dehydrogenase family protein n=1 Tax=Phenylobacterium montanum TaxID=2823693 RepID=A0A975IUP4_9CAUL|nr:zinc-dependent alcohol dehydrogenase family protein [Caulobacter sp. S6]QUD86461.1 zinc-dependent alcohol dehydrogenase family protein [Caulobacter sp. S6]
MTAQASMRALFVDAPDAPFRSATVARPVPGHGQALVRIQASGINPLDLKIRAGAAAHARQPLPAVLGLDLAGVVEDVGPGVTGLKVGDEVYGMVGGVGGLQGTLAEFAAVDADLLARKPASLSMLQAAALPLVTVTAWEGLVERARVQPGQSVLVIGAAGGVGHVAVQIARSLGAEVYGVDRAARGEVLRGLGATPINADTDVQAYVAEHGGGRGFDVVYDTVGGAGLDAAFRAVKARGHVVSSLGWGTHALAPLSFKSASYSGVFTLDPLLTGEGRARQGDILRRAARLADEGRLTPRLDPRRFTLESVAEAYDAIGRRTAEGKLVVSID